MIVRTKGGDFRADSSAALLDFLGVKKEAGAAKVRADVELIAAALFVSGNRELLSGNREQVTGNTVRCASAEDLTDNILQCTGAPDTQGTKDTGGVAWTLSTFDLDRYEERIDPAGWDFSQFVKNPVVQWAHRYDVPAIGKIEGLTVDDTGLHGVVVFNDKAFDAFGWSIGERVKAGVIRAGSVGFRAIEIEIPDRETAKDGTSLIFRKQELLEFSICNIPANPFALAKSANSDTAETTQGNGRSYWGGLINNLQGA